MAKAQVKIVEITPAVAAVTDERVVVEFTMQEALLVKSVFGKFYGGSELAAVSAGVFNALYDVLEEDLDIRLSTGNIHEIHGLHVEKSRG